MDAKIKSSRNDEVQVLDMVNYFGWRSKMKSYFNKLSVREIVVNPLVEPNNKTKTTTENAITLP